ncbi:heavy-metal-associated domain-containing protein [Flagellimonas marinaquae]|uniref:heavy-metal-associated domain-containing protein n=1 Tax=Flagellimonas marinaquae TaxID=254955 RepID=UPI0020754B26|nr:heavy metal-associated domain-containing protein [Allomuricauda aquimarina]USD24621.1 heavy-metal-associated domain-containing protein [Allomuricauda aquimarina]
MMKNSVLVIIMVLLVVDTLSAQITYVDQEVYGMDCAPCAYGLERGLKKMDGLQKVRVSLNDGRAYLDLAAENELTLGAIQEEVKKNGVSAKKAAVTVSGKLSKENGQWLVASPREQFLVSQATSTEYLEKMTEGNVTVSGTVDDVEDDNLPGQWILTISKMERIQ